MKRFLILCVGILSLFAVCLLNGCHYGAGSLANGKADLPIPDTILLRNNDTGLTLEYTSSDEEFDLLYDHLNGDGGLYEEKKELCYHQMLYTAPGSPYMLPGLFFPSRFTARENLYKKLWTDTLPSHPLHPLPIPTHSFS